MEKTSRKFWNDEISLLWGIVDDVYENHPNISTIRQQSLYLPGYVGAFTSSLPDVYLDNLPASIFYKNALAGTYAVDASGGSTAEGDYSGGANMAMASRYC